LVLGRWTVDRRRLHARATLQLATFAGLTLWLLPTYVMSQGDGRWSYLVDGPVWRTSLILQLLALAAVPAVASVVEFAVRGRGTPYPCDPPSELVTTGPFAYVANPMQVSVVLVLGLLAVGTHSWSLAIATAGSVAFSEFVAEPHERGELPGRFGAEWAAYSSQVRRWVVRRTPYRPGTAELYLAESCMICRQTRALLESTGPRGLTLQAAEGHAGSLQRALYVGLDGLQARGLAAVARGFEHSGLGWAYLGWLLRLPVLRPLVQLLLDGMGGGPRQLPDRDSGGVIRRA
jgi:protein-S-isoprenylcysteine O-methyltransferase Ste14